MSTLLDVAIVGGGPAGMSAALVAGRSRLRAMVLNEERPRNLVTAASHGFLTRDGVHPRDLMKHAQEDLRKYPTVSYEADRVVGVKRDGPTFHLELASGRALQARRLVIATGHRDDLEKLRLPGLRDVYGSSVFPCPFCDGYERAGERLAVFGGVGVETYAALVKMWSDDVAVFTNGMQLAPSARTELARNGVALHESKVQALESTGGRLRAVRLDDGRVERDAGFLWDQPGVPSTTLADDLGVRRSTHPRGIVTYETDEAGATNVAGVFVVGDMRTGFSKLIGAASEGALAMQRIVHEIARERWTS